jgi:hypothetical protein
VERPPAVVARRAAIQERGPQRDRVLPGIERREVDRHLRRERVVRVEEQEALEMITDVEPRRPTEP